MSILLGPGASADPEAARRSRDRNRRAIGPSGLGLPVRLEAVVLVDRASPSLVREVRPLRILVEAGGGLQLVLVDVDDQLVLGAGEIERLPRHGEQLVAHAQ